MNVSSYAFTCVLRVCLYLLFYCSAVACNQALGQSDYNLALLKSQRMAKLGIQRLASSKSPYSSAPFGMRYVYPFRRPIGARYEGVGYSAFSPADAIRNACFYGRRSIRTYAVVRGRDGYYATVFYR